jgi:hypothetical protein
MQASHCPEPSFLRLGLWSNLNLWLLQVEHGQWWCLFSRLYSSETFFLGPIFGFCYKKQGSQSFIVASRCFFFLYLYIFFLQLFPLNSHKKNLEAFNRSIFALKACYFSYIDLFRLFLRILSLSTTKNSFCSLITFEPSWSSSSDSLLELWLSYESSDWEL